MQFRRRYSGGAASSLMPGPVAYGALIACDLEGRVLDLVHVVYGGSMQRQVPVTWLQRPGREDCGSVWTTAERIYAELTGLELPEEMPLRQRRTVDAVLQRGQEPQRIVEVDERQHFNAYRAQTIRAYPAATRVAWDRAAWLAACDAKSKPEGGGFGRPVPPLFPSEGGRHRQRAFRDALTDLLPAEHAWLPTLRIADFEVTPWLWDPGAERRLRELLDARLAAA